MPKLDTIDRSTGLAAKAGEDAELRVLSRSVVSDSATPWTVAHQAPLHGIAQARVGCHSLLQGIFPVQEWNLCLLHWPDSLPLSHLGSPKLMWSGCQMEQCFFLKH